MKFELPSSELVVRCTILADLRALMLIGVNNALWGSGIT
jgi:hypothetical protein